MTKVNRSKENRDQSRFLRFAASALLSYCATRFLADFLHLRLYVTHERVHLHHFLLGLMLTPLSWIAFENERKTEAELLAGTITGLFLSEIKQLILEQWGP